MVITTCGSDGFAMPMAVMLYSALTHLPASQPVRVFVVEDGVTPANRARLERVVRRFPNVLEVGWITPPPSALAEVPVTSRYGRSAFLRLLIPAHLPASLTRAIYLDGDMAVERDLRDLWYMDMDGAPALAVENYGSPLVSDAGSLAETYQEQGIPPDAPYCNTGLLLMDLTAWREQDIAQKVIRFSIQNKQYIRNADQDGINAVIGAKWKLLDPRWNVQVLTIQKLGLQDRAPNPEDLRRQREVLRSAYVLHYAGHLKPWMHRYRRQRGDRFLHYAQASGWFDPLTSLRWRLTRDISHRTLFVLARLRDAVRRLFGRDKD